MNDIQRMDQALLRKAFLRPARLFTVAAAAFALWVVWSMPFVTGKVWFLLGTAACFGLYFMHKVFQDFERSKFRYPRFALMWDVVQDRRKRLTKALRMMKKDGHPELEILPKTIDEVAGTVYAALRRADAIQQEFDNSESRAGLPVHRGFNAPEVVDDHAKELYRLADKNIAEYMRRRNGVLATIQRCEAQSAVFTTTLDSLRMHVLGIRLTDRNPNVSHQEFVDALQLAKEQLAAVDLALTEMDYEQMQAIAELDELKRDTPPPIPGDVQLRERP